MAHVKFVLWGEGQDSSRFLSLFLFKTLEFLVDLFVCFALFTLVVGVIRVVVARVELLLLFSVLLLLLVSLSRYIFL